MLLPVLAVGVHAFLHRRGSYTLRIETERLVIRFFEAEDAGALHAAVQASLRELQSWLDWCRNGYTADDAATWVRASRRTGTSTDTYSFGIFERDREDRFVGCVGLSGISSGTANVGYWVDTRHRGNGYAREAVCALACRARERLGLTRLEIAVHPENAPSIGVARSLPSRYEGIAPRRIRHRGELVDAMVFILE